MKDSRIASGGLVLLGCGKMGSAMLTGWLEKGLPPASVYVIEPYASDWLRASGVNLNTTLPEAPAIVLLAVNIFASVLLTLINHCFLFERYLSISLGASFSSLNTFLLLL